MQLYAYEGTANVHLVATIYEWVLACLHPDIPCQLLCSVINIAMSNNYERGKPFFNKTWDLMINTNLNYMCTLHIFFSVTKLDLVTQARTVTRLHSCSGKKIRVLLACILFLYRKQYF